MGSFAATMVQVARCMGYVPLLWPLERPPGKDVPGIGTG